MSEKENTVEIPEASMPVMEKEPITPEQAKEKGWSNTEIKKAEEFGLVGKKTEEKPKEEAKKEETSPKEEEGKEVGKVAPIKADKSRYELDVDQQKKFEEIFGPGTNPHGLFHGMKSQRNRAQAAESARDAAKLELKLKEQQLKEAQERIDSIVSKGLNQNGNGEGDGEDPMDKPLTPRQLKAMQEEENKKRESIDGENKERAQKIHLALKEQEDYARSQYQDFDETVKAGEELIKRINELEGVEKKRAIGLIGNLQIAA